MRRRARVVVVGGGIIGCSILYRLARFGWSDLVLIEKSELTAGVTWHSAGHLIQVEEDLAIARITNLSHRLYGALEAETGQAIGLHKPGSIRLAVTPGRLEKYRRLEAQMRLLGVPYEVVGPAAMKAHFPLMATDGLVGGSWAPEEGHVDPSMATQAFAKGARDRGAEIRRQTRVTGFARTREGWRIATSAGDLEAEIVVLATGFWAPDMLAPLGVRLPILPTERQYIVTEAVAEIRGLGFELPILRDFDVPFYFRQERDSLIMGVHEPHTPFCFVDGIPPDFGQELLPPDLERGAQCIAAGMKRVPVMERLGIKRVICGPTSRTPDFHGLVGPVPNLRDFYVAAGFSAGVSQGAAVGQLLAEWIVEGEPSLDMTPLDVARFGPYATKRYIRSMLGEAHSYGMLDLGKERLAGRPARSSPLHHRLAARGARFTARLGWECPSWFAAGGADSEAAAVAAECAAIRDRCGVADLASLAKYEVSGPGAAAHLAALLGAGVPRAAGAVGFALATRPSGRVEGAFTVARLADERFYLTAAPAAQYHHRRLLQRGLPQDGSVMVEDLTGRWGALLLAGPGSRRVLAPLTDQPLDNEAFPWRTLRETAVGYAPVRLLRCSAVGELAWELHHPIEYHAALYEALGEALPSAVADIGLKALDALRMEKAWPLWGSELTGEAGRDRRGVWLTLPLAPGESAAGAVLFRAGAPVGAIRASAYGHRVGTGVGFAVIAAGAATPGTTLDLSLGDRPCVATVADGPLYDPEDRRPVM